ncbi:hypothetical protein WG66_002596, partial [Moniliophthora roreri]
VCIYVNGHLSLFTMLPYGRNAEHDATTRRGQGMGESSGPPLQQPRRLTSLAQAQGASSCGRILTSADFTRLPTLNSRNRGTGDVVTSSAGESDGRTKSGNPVGQHRGSKRLGFAPSPQAPKNVRLKRALIGMTERLLARLRTGC